MAVTDVWADWSSTAANNSPAGGAAPEIDDEFRNIKAQCKGNAVALSGNQTVAGVKTFSSTPFAPGLSLTNTAGKALFAMVGSGDAGDYTQITMANNDSSKIWYISQNKDRAANELLISHWNGTSVVHPFIIGPTGNCQHLGDTFIISASKTPASSTATGTTGSICWDGSYVYVCISTNAWRRAALASW